MLKESLVYVCVCVCVYRTFCSVVSPEKMILSNEANNRLKKKCVNSACFSSKVFASSWKPNIQRCGVLRGLRSASNSLPLLPIPNSIQ